MLQRLAPLLFLLPVSIIVAQCSRGEELPTDPYCWCICSDKRVPVCNRPQQDDCPPSPVCASDDECEPYCQSDDLCGEGEPSFVGCNVGADGYTQEVLCREIPQCDSITEEECLVRFTPFDCTFEWLFYRLCISEEGCDSPRCQTYLQGWADCKASE